MGASKEEFINVRMSTPDYHELPDYIKSSMDIKFIDVENVDYSDSELWVSQKKVSDKEFKKLKKIEFDIRNNNK